MFEEQILSNDFVTLTVKEFLMRLAAALGIGLVIGFERERSGIRDKNHHFAGARTFTIVSLLGFVSGIAAGFVGIWIIYLILAGLILLVAISYFTTTSKGDIGATTEFTLITCFLLGFLSLLGNVQIALALTVLILTLLSLKPEMKAAAGKITQDEIFAFLKFTVLAALILPFLPDKTIDPYQVFNPREILLVVILTSGLNFGGYLLIKFLGAERGILLAGIVGGFISSTIVTWTFSKRSRENNALSKSYAASILFASTIMPVRVIIWIYIFNRPLFPELALVLLLLASTAFLYAFILMKRNSDDISNETLLPENPLNLGDALKFGALFTGILYLVHFAVLYFGSKGILAAAAISGLSDVDAITISLAKLSDGAVTPLIILNGILLAVLSNTVVKLGMALFYGSAELKKYVGIGYGIVFIAGAVGFVILNFF